MAAMKNAPTGICSRGRHRVTALVNSIGEPTKCTYGLTKEQVEAHLGIPMGTDDIQ